ncbi:MAG: sugar phosphate isomerase/epimerase [Lachnospiraceae bacterium]|jgi:sugar phosphate isomerase/epimerase|nr:sugar phosphate isomerase/epimerase [Lachnospiraceae bacterium]
MRLSTSTNIVAFNPGRERNGYEFCVKLCAQAGYRVLDLNFCEAMNPDSRMRGDGWEEYVEEIGELGAGCGVEFAQCHLPYYDVFDPASAGQAPLMEELIRRSILAAGRLGVKWAVTHPGTDYGAGPDLGASLGKNLEYYSPHVELATKSGVGIALENDFEYQKAPFRRIFASYVPELCALADSFGAPGSVGVCYDFGHGNLTGAFHAENLRIIGKRLKAIHVADNLGDKDAHLMPYFGNIDWSACMEALAEIGYDGDLTYEIQEFARYMPNDLKYAAVELSVKVGGYLIGIYERALSGR